MTTSSPPPPPHYQRPLNFSIETETSKVRRVLLPVPQGLLTKPLVKLLKIRLEQKKQLSIQGEIFEHVRAHLLLLLVLVLAPLTWCTTPALWHLERTSTPIVYAYSYD